MWAVPCISVCLGSDAEEMWCPLRLGREAWQLPQVKPPAEEGSEVTDQKRV